MIYTYDECKERYHTDYGIRKAVADGGLFRISRGIYSDMEMESELDIISMKYPYAVFTLNSAFYYHGLTDTIPDKFYLMTDKDATKIKDRRVKQVYDNYDSLQAGQTEKKYSGTKIRIFDKERMLVELIRYKNRMPFDYYKEIIGNYRKQIYGLDIQNVQEYAMRLPKTRMIMDTLQLEVF